MRPLICLSHKLHCRNWLTSGMLDKLGRSGITGAVAMPTALAVHCRAMIPAGWDLLPLEPWWSTRAQARVREALRLGMLVEGAQRGGKNYQMKVRAKRRPVPTGQMLGWRALSTVVEPLYLIRAIERALPAPRAAFPHGYTHLILPTLIHEDEAQAGLVKAARRAGAPVLAVPASWDSLMTKGRFLDQPDRIAVWGPESAVHAYRDHGFRLDQIAITGPPHFYPYQDGYRAPWLQLPFTRHIVFAGTTINYAADEVHVVTELGRRLAGTLATRDVVVFYRPHPRQQADRIAALKTAPRVIVDINWSGGWDLKPETLAWIKTICQRALCTVSAFSTVVLEAALCGKPSILVGFGDSAHGIGKALDHAQYDHMEAMIGKRGIWLADTMERLIDLIVKCCAGSQQIQPDPIRQWALKIAAVSTDPRDNLIAWMKGAG